MAFSPIRIEGDVKAEHLSRIQDNVARALDQAATQPILNGVLLSSVALAVGSNIVNHGLGRTLRGWIPVRLRASATVYDTQDSNSTPALTLLLTASAAVTADLWVF